MLPTFSSRKMSWSPPPWTVLNQAGVDQRIPNLASIIQEIVNRTGWSSGNSIVIIIGGTGKRTADAYEGVQTAAPLLHIEWSIPPGNQAPMVGINSPRGNSTFTVAYEITFTGIANDPEDGDLTPR